MNGCQDLCADIARLVSRLHALGTENCRKPAKAGGVKGWHSNFKCINPRPKTHFVASVINISSEDWKQFPSLWNLGGILGFWSNSSLETAARFWKCCSLKSAARSGAWLRSCEGVRGACRSALSIRWLRLGWLKPWPPKRINIDEQKPEAPNFVVLFKHILAFVAITTSADLEKNQKMSWKRPRSQRDLCWTKRLPHIQLESSCCCEVWWGNSGRDWCGSRMSVLVERNGDIFTMIRPGMRIEELEQPGCLVVQVRCPHSFLGLS